MRKKNNNNNFNNNFIIGRNSVLEALKSNSEFNFIMFDANYMEGYKNGNTNNESTN